VGTLLLNAAERMDDELLNALVVRARLTLAEWVAPDVVVGADFVPTRVPEGVRNALTTQAMESWAHRTAQMAYTIIADNGYGLITAAHHFRGQAANAALNTLKMYELDKVARDLGLVPKEVTSFIFHDVLHPLAYEKVAGIANALPPRFTSKVASTVLKRLPAYPGGTTHVQRAITVRRVLVGYTRLGTVLEGLWDSEADLALLALDALILANPLDFNIQFRPAEAAANQPRVVKVVPLCITLFGIYDASFPPRRGEEDSGPTRGPGIRKLIEENISIYQSAFDSTVLALGEAAPVTLALVINRIVAAFRHVESPEPEEAAGEEAAAEGEA